MGSAFVKFVFIVILAFIAAIIICYYAFKDDQLVSYDFGTILIERIRLNYYKKIKRINNYDDYSKIEKVDTDDFISFWYED